jgi:transcriptional regulator with XRE-family HTH domain
VSPVCRRCGGSGVELDLLVVGTRIRAARQRRALGLRQMARLMKVTAAYVCDLENGRRPFGGPAAQRILKFLKIEVSDG